MVGLVVEYERSLKKDIFVGGRLCAKSGPIMVLKAPHEVVNFYRPLHLAIPRQNLITRRILTHCLIELLDCTYHGFYCCPVKFCPVVFLMSSFIEVSPFT